MSAVPLDPSLPTTAINSLRRPAPSQHPAKPAPPPPPPSDFVANGDSLLKQGEYAIAVQAYSRALEEASSDQQKGGLHLRRAQAHLPLDNFGSAYRDSFAAVSLCRPAFDDSTSTRSAALLVHAQALEGMRLFPLAVEAYEAVLDAETTSESAQEGKERVERMIDQSATGEYDWLKLEKEVKEAERGKKLLRVRDLGDSVGPVEVVAMDERGGGRGVVAKRDIEPGELLLVEKAFAVGASPEKVLKQRAAPSAMPLREQVNLVDNIVRRMLDDASTVPVVYSLYGGPTFPSSAEASLYSLVSRALGVEKLEEVDPVRVHGIAAYNAFSIDLAADDSTNPLDPSAALFLNASLFNHSCTPNAYWTVLSGLVIIRSVAPIKADEEVFIAYVQANEPRTDRIHFSRSHFGNIGCSCQLCQLDAADGPDQLDRRSDLLEQVHSVRHDNLPRAEKKRNLVNLVSQLEATFLPSHPLHLRPEMIRPYRSLAKLTGRDSPSSRLEANEYDLKALEGSGAILEDDEEKKEIKIVQAPYVRQKLAVPLLLSVAGRLVLNGSKEDEEQARRYYRAAVSMDGVLRGSDMERFLFEHGEEVKKQGLERVCETEFGTA